MTDASTIASHCPDVDPDLIERHLERVDDAYLGAFDAQAIASHVRAIAHLSRDMPVEVLLKKLDASLVECTVVAFDHPFEFSLITGTLAGTGFQIQSGDVFTIRRAPSTQGHAPRRSPMSLRRRPRKPVERDPQKHAVIVDRFVGTIDDSDVDFDAWSEGFTKHLTHVVGLLDKGDDESVHRAKQRVNELVTAHLAQLDLDGQPMLLPVRLDIDPDVEGRTRVVIVAQDTPAFLYSLSTALSLHKLTIERVTIHSDHDNKTVRDELFVVDRKGRAVEDPREIEHVKLSVLLTKQFTYFLHQSPDPFSALTRFEAISEDIMLRDTDQRWFDLLANPRAMEDLAKLLGTSDFLWEDYIRGQYEQLLEIISTHTQRGDFCEPPESIPYRIEQALKPAIGLAEQRDRLNRFKARETFLLDLDNILRPGSDFREFARRLTLLAENLIQSASDLVYKDLVYSYGEPIDKQGGVAEHAVFGLGKLGGIALGYASDIELLFVYRGGGKTRGGKRDAISNREFFVQHARETSQFIRSKREGIFDVDLRLRPYGKEGPLACSIDHFKEYYQPSGPAHDFERLALVRLRWIAGSPSLGYDLENLRDDILYHEAELDLDALWDLWARQRAEKLSKAPSGSHGLNAKYSPGALVDLEGTVQLLQVMHAGKVPQLRTPRISGAMEGLRRADVITPADFASLFGGYRFFRQLINALRMLRGNAQDLFLPAVESHDFLHLARRMGYERLHDRSSADQLMAEFQDNSSHIRAFVEKRFNRPCPGC